MCSYLRVSLSIWWYSGLENQQFKGFRNSTPLSTLSQPASRQGHPANSSRTLASGVDWAILHNLLACRSFSNKVETQVNAFFHGLRNPAVRRAEPVSPLQGTSQPASLQGTLRTLQNLLSPWSRRGVVYSLLCQALVTPLAYKVPCQFSILSSVVESFFVDFDQLPDVASWELELQLIRYRLYEAFYGVFTHSMVF